VPKEKEMLKTDIEKAVSVFEPKRLFDL